MADHSFKILRATVNRRLPMLGLALASLAGIVFADYVDLPSEWMAGLFLSFCLISFRWRTLGVLLATFFAFALSHTLQTRASPGAWLSEQFEGNTQRIIATGKITDHPQDKRSRQRFSFSPEQFTLPDLQISIDQPISNLTFLVSTQTSHLKYGDRIQLQGILYKPRSARNPGEFDFADWLSRQGIWFELFADHVVTIESKQGNMLIVFGLQLKTFFSKLLSTGIGDFPEAAALIQGMTLGSYAGADRIQKAFRDTGTYHLFSVSGLHVAMVGLIVSIVSHPLGRRLSLTLTLIAIALYTLTTGLRPAGVRAAIMGSLVFAGMGVERRPQIINSLSCAFIILLATHTNLLFNTGFQLSFMVVAGIIVGARPLEHILLHIHPPDPFLPKAMRSRLQTWKQSAIQTLSSMAGVSLAAWVASLPLIMLSFHITSWIGPLANLFALPLAFAILALALTAILGGSIYLPLADIFNQTNAMLSMLLIGGIQMLSSIPGGHSLIGKSCPTQTVELIISDIGRGGCSLLRTRGFNILIDCGSTTDAQYTITSLLRHYGASRLDGLILTHGDSSHIGGWEIIEQTFNPRDIIDSLDSSRSSIAKSLLGNRQEKSHVSQSIDLDPFLQLKHMPSFVRIERLHPRRGFTSSLADDNALVLLLHLYSTRVLLLSDAGPITTAQLAIIHPHIQADVVVMGRHFEGSFPTISFLKHLGAKVIVTTVDDYPMSETLDLSWTRELLEAGIMLFRQDKTGAILCKFQEKGYQIRSFLTNTAYERLLK